MKTAPNIPIAAFRMAKSADEGVTVHVTCSDAAVGPPARDWNAIGQTLALQPATDAGTSADLCIQLADTLPTRPGHATRVSRDARGTVWQSPSEWYIARASYAAKIERDAPQATLAVDHAASVPPQALWAHAFRDVLTLLLPRTGWMPLHAAAVCPPSPDTESRSAVLLVGPSGCGKSTLTTGVLLRGWSCISDDMLVLSPHTSTVSTHAHSLAQTIHVCEDAWERLKLNAPMGTESNSLFGQFTERAKRPLTRQALPDSACPTAHPTAHRVPYAPPTCIVLPAITDAPTSRLTPAQPAEALATLMEQGVPPALLPADAARTQWQQMGRLIRQCATYRLHAGRDLYRDPGHLAALLHASTGISA